MVMQGDGNLVVYSASGQACWASHTAGNNGAKLRLWDKGILTIDRADNNAWLWTSRNQASDKIELPIWRAGSTVFYKCNDPDGTFHPSKNYGTRVYCNGDWVNWHRV